MPIGHRGTGLLHTRGIDARFRAAGCRDYLSDLDFWAVRKVRLVANQRWHPTANMPTDVCR